MAEPVAGKAVLRKMWLHMSVNNLHQRLQKCTTGFVINNEDKDQFPGGCLKKERGWSRTTQPHAGIF